MNINRLARNQQMLYNFMDRNQDYASRLSQMQSQFSGFDALNNTKQLDADSLMQQMGVGGLEGRTVREMAKYKLDTQKAPEAAQPDTSDLGISLPTQQFSSGSLYTPISDEATAAMQKLALQDAANSVGGNASTNTDERVSLIQEHLQDVAPSRRTASFNTMNKVWESELERIGEYIKENDPSWNYWGDAFDTGILENYVPGVNVWA